MRPNEISVVVMETIDAMPRWQRKLVYEYGLNAVLSASNAGEFEVKGMRRFLKARRKLKQSELLSTHYGSGAS